MQLDPLTWDLVLDSSGNIAAAAPPLAVAQDAASQIRTFSGEVYYDTRQGLPYFAQILGKVPPVELMRARFNAAAKTVPGVATVKTFLTSLSPRGINGQVQTTDVNGDTAAAGF